MQTKFGKGGDCFSACIASILELPLSDVPVFCDYPNWREQTNIFLAEFGLAYVDIHLPGDLRDNLVEYWGYHIIAGKSSRGLRHAVVGYKGTMIHDPHPSGDGLMPEVDGDATTDYEYGLFVSKMDKASIERQLARGGVMSEQITGFGVTKRNEHHWDIYPARGQWLHNGGHRLFTIRGEPGRVVVYNEMDYPAPGDQPGPWGSHYEFSCIETAMSFISGILMSESPRREGE